LYNDVYFKNIDLLKPRTLTSSPQHFFFFKVIIENHIHRSSLRISPEWCCQCRRVAACTCPQRGTDWSGNKASRRVGYQSLILGILGEHSRD